MKKLVFILSAVVFLTATQSITAQSKSIVDIAVGNKDFSTLVTALKAADLVGALQGDGPFTVFAPNNAAFEKVDSKALANLLKPENKKALANVLTYHVVSGKYAAADVMKVLKKNGGTVELTALNGQTFKVRKGTDGIYLKDSTGNYSKIISTDIMANNGVIHVIEEVVMPK